MLYDLVCGYIRVNVCVCANVNGWKREGVGEYTFRTRMIRARVLCAEAGASFGAAPGSRHCTHDSRRDCSSCSTPEAQSVRCNMEGGLMLGSANAKPPAAAEDRSIQCNLRLPTLTRKHKERERDREGGRKWHNRRGKMWY
jgi:hypothetical protein